MPHPHRMTAALALCALLPAPLAHAADEAQVLAAPCAACHGPDGVSPGAIPSIAGKPRDELEAQLTAFRDDPPSGTTVMDRHMKGYDDAQIALLARYFAQVQP